MTCHTKEKRPYVSLGGKKKNYLNQEKARSLISNMLGCNIFQLFSKGTNQELVIALLVEEKLMPFLIEKTSGAP